MRGYAAQGIPTANAGMAEKPRFLIKVSSIAGNRPADTQ
jgi:hypothetical protein